MKVRRFNPADDLIIVKARLYGPRGDRPLLLAFDTAATETHIVPEIVDDLGYSPRQGEAITSVRSAIGKERGYLLRVTRFASFGFSFPDFVSARLLRPHRVLRGGGSTARSTPLPAAVRRSRGCGCARGFQLLRDRGATIDRRRRCPRSDHKAPRAVSSASCRCYPFRAEMDCCACARPDGRRNRTQRRR